MVFMGQCTEACGWFAAVSAALAWGSFGVPIKSISKVSVDPLVMQTFKVTVCFLTSWLIIPMGEDFSFTPWGIASGIFWVPGATAGIYGIRQAGLAIAVGTWSPLVVMVSVCWGIGVFHERVRSVPGAIGAVLLMSAGLSGMSVYSHSSPPPPSAKSAHEDGDTEAADSDEERVPLTLEPGSDGGDDQVLIEGGEVGAGLGLVAKRRHSQADGPHLSASADGRGSDGSPPEKPKKERGHLVPLEMEIPEEGGCWDGSPKKNSNPSNSDVVVLFNGKIAMPRRRLGILGAVFNGTWGGTCLIPMHYAKRDGFTGPGYVISFACGSMVVLLCMWLLRYLFQLFRVGGCHRSAMAALPSFHLREMGLQGTLSGLLYSIGNFSSIIATHHLGQSVGYSLTQSSMLVSGVWGIFYFGEVQGSATISKWLVSATVTVVGILWLSYEHEGDMAHR